MLKDLHYLKEEIKRITTLKKNLRPQKCGQQQNEDGRGKWIISDYCIERTIY